MNRNEQVTGSGTASIARVSAAGTTHQDQLRRQWRAHFELCQRVHRENEARNDRFFAAANASRYRPHEGDLPLPPFPAELRGLPCGAKTRLGTECKRTDLALNGRCKFHGGLSTGPKSAAGRERAKANLAMRWPSEPHERTAFDSSDHVGSP